MIVTSPSCGIAPNSGSPLQIGQQFGGLTVMSYAGGKHWLVTCQCGNIRSVRKRDLLNGKTRSCGCTRGPRSNLTGSQFGRLTVEGFAGRGRWHVRCRCGTQKRVLTEHLNRGAVISCGCSKRDKRLDLIGKIFNYLTVTGYAGKGRWIVQCVCGRSTAALHNHLRTGRIRSCGCGRYRDRYRLQPDTPPPPGSRWVPLSRGLFALVAECDYDAVSRHIWYAQRGGLNTWYAARKDGERNVLLHRFILSAPPGTLVDHVNGDGLDCRRTNIRLATPQQNAANKRPRRCRQSIYKGIYWSQSKNGWVAETHHGGIKKTKLCRTEAEAAQAYNELARRAFGDYARLNEIPPC